MYIPQQCHCSRDFISYPIFMKLHTYVLKHRLLYEFAFPQPRSKIKVTVTISMNQHYHPSGDLLILKLNTCAHKHCLLFPFYWPRSKVKVSEYNTSVWNDVTALALSFEDRMPYTQVQCQTCLNITDLSQRSRSQWLFYICTKWHCEGISIVSDALVIFALWKIIMTHRCPRHNFH